MKTFFSLVVLLLIFLDSTRLSAQNLAEQEIKEEIKESKWKGFKRYDFTWEQRDVRIIVPSKAVSGKPWLWRARFPDWHTEADSILVTKGFHIVYINTDNKYGSPDAVRVWDELYQYLTEKYQLSRKVALAGVSRGGLIVYNWAKANPEKVACIYSEAPVCDFKSWPGGFGTGKGSAADWIELKKEYGFDSDETARAYQNNPLNNLEALARAKVPVLHMISLNDMIVPPEENTFPLVDQYTRLGGMATIVPCTEGVQTLEGHHFPIETPQYVADFISYHSLPAGALESSDYHQMRGGLQNSRLQFERNKKGHVAFLGGSITYNGGWRDSICAYLTRRFPDTEFEFIAAGIPSMGSTPGAFRLERDILSRGPVDLLFEEAAVNDAVNGRSSREQLRAMEGIVRHVRRSNPAADLVTMHFVDPDKMEVYRAGGVPEVIVNHEKVADHYQVPSIHLAKEVTDRIDAGEFTWEDDFVNLHPSPFGQGVYAHSMITFLNNAFSGHVDADDKIKTHTSVEALDPFSYDKGYLIEASTVRPPKGWHIDESWTPADPTGTRANYVHVPMLICEESGRLLKYKFSGRAIGIAIAAGQDAGMIEYRIDKDDWQKLNLFTKWSSQLHLPWYYTLAAELTEGDHTLQLRISKDKDPQSTGHACRIRYFYVNGN